MRHLLWAMSIACVVAAAVYHLTGDGAAGLRAALLGVALVVLLLLTRPRPIPMVVLPRLDPDPSAPNSPLDNQLMQAAWDGDVAWVRELLAAGANVERVNHNGNTPLHLAIENMHLEVVRVLLDAGADVNRRTPVDRWTPLFHAVGIVSDAARQIEQPPENELIRLLLQYGADVRAVTSKGDTALDLAGRYDNAEAVELLIAAGALRDR